MEQKENIEQQQQQQQQFYNINESIISSDRSSTIASTTELNTVNEPVEQHYPQSITVTAESESESESESKQAQPTPRLNRIEPIPAATATATATVSPPIRLKSAIKSKSKPTTVTATVSTTARAIHSPHLHHHQFYSHPYNRNVSIHSHPHPRNLHIHIPYHSTDTGAFTGTDRILSPSSSPNIVLSPVLPAIGTSCAAITIPSTSAFATESSSLLQTRRGPRSLFNPILIDYNSSANRLYNFIRKACGILLLTAFLLLFISSSTPHLYELLLIDNGELLIGAYQSCINLYGGTNNLCHHIELDCKLHSLTPTVEQYMNKYYSAALIHTKSSSTIANPLDNPADSTPDHSELVLISSCSLFNPGRILLLFSLAILSVSSCSSMLAAFIPQLFQFNIDQLSLISGCIGSISGLISMILFIATKLQDQSRSILFTNSIAINYGYSFILLCCSWSITAIGLIAFTEWFKSIIEQYYHSPLLESPVQISQIIVHTPSISADTATATATATATVSSSSIDSTIKPSLYNSISESDIDSGSDSSAKSI